MAKSNVETATELLGVFSEAGVKDIFEQRPWMVGKKFILITTQIELEKLVDEMISGGVCALDTETNGLNTRQKNGQPWNKIVGFCISNNPDVGYYVPVGHSDTEYNVPMVVSLRELARLVANCICIFHNFKFDGQLLRNYGIIIDDADKYEDTLLMAAVEDASRRRKGLKELSEKILQRPMLEIKDMGIQATGKVEKLFFMVPPPKAVYYGAGDAMCTFALYLHFKKRLDEMDPTKRGGPWYIYKVEKQCLFATMEMERNYARLDIPYLKKLREDIIVRMTNCQEGIYAIIGRNFDIESPKQLGILLFDELKIKYPVKEKSDSGQYITDESVLEKLKDQYPIANMILTFRGFRKILSTYLDNFLNNADENDEVKFQMNQVQADTGRFSASGGYGLEEDGYCGVNCQNIPKYNKKDPNSVDLRKAIIGRPGTKIVTVDYSGEELRIATNISKEPKWLNEFLHGSGDLHAITGRAIHQKAVIDDKERSIGKTLNFLTLFGGGPGRFSAQAKIPYETAKKFIINFFNSYTVLKSWIDKEAKVSRKRGFSLTAFGRRRPLTEYYATNDKEEMAKGDRLAINSRIQGTGADILKIALYRLYRWVHNNGLEEYIRIIMPIHDEIVFEVREDKLNDLIPEICEIMKLKDKIKQLQWEVPLEVDAEYGDSYHVTNNYWEERKEKEETKVEKQVAVTENSEKIQTSVEVSTDRALTVGTTTVNNAISVFKDVLCSTDSVGIIKENVSTILEENFQNNLVPIFRNAKPADRIGPDGYFYHVIKADAISARKIRYILDILSSSGQDFFIGPKYRICLVGSDGEVIHRVTENIAIDSFLALCLDFGI